jgi:predicted nuclease of predicted toxin-antitoxin system
VKLLFDQNLSRFLVDQLRDAFPDSAHVTTLDLVTASDRTIWDYALEHGFVIVSKDSDFRQLSFLRGPPPKAIWLRVGNVSTSAVFDLLLGNVDLIERFGASEEEAFLVLPRLRPVP